MIFFEYVDFWAKSLLFRTHHLWNSTTKLILLGISNFGYEMSFTYIFFIYKTKGKWKGKFTWNDNFKCNFQKIPVSLCVYRAFYIHELPTRPLKKHTSFYHRKQDTLLRKWVNGIKPLWCHIYNLHIWFHEFYWFVRDYTFF